VVRLTKRSNGKIFSVTRGENQANTSFRTMLFLRE